MPFFNIFKNYSAVLLEAFFPFFFLYLKAEVVQSLASLWAVLKYKFSVSYTKQAKRQIPLRPLLLGD